MNHPQYISFCGDNCSLCPRYIATQKNDENELAEVAELWYRLGFRDTVISNEDIRCSGCSRNKVCGYNITSCEHLGENKNCGECERFPCEIINTVFKKTEQYAVTCHNKCTEKLYEQLFQAFYMKEDILTAIHAAKYNDSGLNNE